MKIRGTATTAAGVTAILLASVLLMLSGLFVSAWILMLIAGALHADVSTAVPAFSFVQTVLVTVALSAVGSFFKK